jgi:hypothetical protein
MSLSLVAYQHVKHINDPRLSELDELHQVLHGDFPEQAGTLVDEGYYQGTRQSFFRIGYGSYHSFREQLAIIAGYQKQAIPEPDFRDPDFRDKAFYWRNPHIADIYVNQLSEGAFIEILCFSDCEGVIDEAHCRKLLVDFNAHEAKAMALANDLPKFWEFYQAFQRALNVAIQKGFIAYC